MTTKTKTEKTAAKDKPVLHIQGGGVRIAIWQNAGKDGAPYFKAGEPELRYRTKTGEWRTAKSYGARDLVNLIKVAALAHTEVARRNRDASAPEPVPTADEDDA